MTHVVYGICKNKCMVPINGEINNITVPVSNWIQTNSGYMNTIAVSGLREDQSPVYMDLDWENSNGNLAILVKNKNLLSYFTYTDGQIILYATKKPSADLVIRLTGVGVNSGVNA